MVAANHFWWAVNSIYHTTTQKSANTDTYKETSEARENVHPCTIKQYLQSTQDAIMKHLSLFRKGRFQRYVELVIRIYTNCPGPDNQSRHKSNIITYNKT